MDEKHTEHLTPEQKQVLVDKGTEPPFSGKFLKHDEPGVYTCAACGATLFTSETKFPAPFPNQGWPSFYEMAEQDAVQLRPDTSHGMERTEAVCNNCGGHLGHVFDDGPAEHGGQHFCINSVALDFKKR
jgi:peptide-methionine (R)-S-oxide reductase